MPPRLNLALTKSIFRRRLTTSTIKKRFTILGIETSCDDTSCAIVTSDAAILAESTISQYKVHEPMGGIVPNLALKHHIKNLPYVVSDVLKKANKSISDMDAIAFTRGPGLPSSLSVGLNASKTLAAALNKPLIGVHHMEAHALTVRLSEYEKVEFPYLCFLISGGHTQIVVVKGVGDYKLLGETLDESIGEAYDKVARVLSLPWNQPIEKEGFLAKENIIGGGPGPALEMKARNGNKEKYQFTIPMNDMHRRSSIAFSFSGLRTQVSTFVKNKMDQIEDNDKEQFKADIAASFQFTVVEHLKQKLRLGFKECEKLNIRPKSLVASGGVASNLKVREGLNEIATENQIPLFCPPARLCTDNGVMIAWAGVERYQLGLFDEYSIDFIPKWPLEDLKIKN
ncbi:UGMP family protein [Neoconidiobolus thromboides FSU 785]|nr:UGMP family protein [Neoconidiobolus thromboides FSU 785]